MAGASRSPHPARAGELVAPFPRADGARTAAVPRIDRNRTVIVTLSMLCYAAAIAVAAYPFLSDRLGAWEAARSFTEQRDAFAAMPSEERETAAADAGAYNDMLAGHPHEDAASPYEEQLHLAADGSLCWIEIPRIGVKEPVYRSSNEEELEAALMTGAAHVRGTSLPVGGTSTNVVITGHTGLRESRMFDQLDLLEPGDAVILWTMGEPLAYEVTGAELVTPDRTDVLCIDEGADHCTLITCRNPESSTALLPNGAYTHRLVVHSDRTGWSPMPEGGAVEHLADARTALFAGSLLATGSLVWIVPAIATKAVMVAVENRDTQPPPPPSRDRHRIQPVTLVPTLAPRMMGMDWIPFIMPEFTKPMTMMVVADELWMAAVTPRPRRTPFQGVLLKRHRMTSSLLPATRLRPSPMTDMP